MQLFYSSEINSELTTFCFDKVESKHIVRVLRKKENDNIYITNGQGFLFECEIVLASEKRCEVKILKSSFYPPKKYHLHLVVAPTKMNDRYEWFLEKATEIGVDEITPIICDHSERKQINAERFEKVILAAAKQSLQYYLPKFNPAVSFSEFIKTKPEGQLFIAHCQEETGKKELADQITPSQPLTILIGPEGDFSEKEIELTLTNGYQPVSLGQTRLRTETAAIVACMTASVFNR